MPIRFKDFVKCGLYYGGFHRLYNGIKFRSRHPLLVIMYHHLIEDRLADRDWSKNGNHTQSQFAAHLKFLKRRFRVLSIEDAISELRNHGKWTKPTASITFDDGYSSTYALAWPILKKLGLSATIYLPTKYLGGGIAPWWLIIEEGLKRWNPVTIPLTEIERAVNISLKAKVDGHLEENAVKARLQAVLREHLERQPDEVAHTTAAQLWDLVKSGNDILKATQYFLSWDQVREMAAGGIRFGAHTRTHANLSELDRSTAEFEVVQSKKDIEQQLSEEITGFAYPYGKEITSYRPFATFLANHGFLYAVTTGYGCNHRTTNPYLLRRITLPITTKRAFIAHEVSAAVFSTPAATNAS